MDTRWTPDGQGAGLAFGGLRPQGDHVSEGVGQEPGARFGGSGMVPASFFLWGVMPSSSDVVG